MFMHKSIPGISEWQVLLELKTSLSYQRYIIFLYSLSLLKEAPNCLCALWQVTKQTHILQLGQFHLQERENVTDMHPEGLADESSGLPKCTL